MIRISSESDLLESFRPFEREEVELPRGLKYPMAISDYLAWEQPAGSRVYLIFEEPDTGKTLGIVFRNDQAAGASPGGHAGHAGHAGMCEWCHSVRGSGQVSLLTATASSRRRVGIALCRDLSCREKLNTDPGPDDLPLGLSPRERIRRVVQRMATFARRNLF